MVSYISITEKYALFSHDWPELHYDTVCVCQKLSMRTVVKIMTKVMSQQTHFDISWVCSSACYDYCEAVTMTTRRWLWLCKSKPCRRASHWSAATMQSSSTPPSLSNNRDMHSLQRSEWSHTKKLVNWIFIKTAKETHLKGSEDAIVNIWHYWLEGNRF